MLDVRYADRADHLVDALADVLADVPADPLAVEVVAVHSRGIERWVAQRLSERLGVSPGRRDGVAGNLDFPFPGRLVGDMVSRATGLKPEDDPWRRDRLPWALLTVVESLLAADDATAVLGPLAGHLRADDGDISPRRLGAVRRVADLFDRYGVHRPTMLHAWADGHDVDGHGSPLPDALRWQPRLWRELRDHLDEASPAERLQRAVAAMRAGDVDLELPDRFCLFGLTALPTTYVEVLRAAATQHRVHLFLLHPSPGLWAQVAATLADRPTVRPLPREQDPSAGMPKHPLLRAWGRDAREMQVVLGEVDASPAAPETRPSTEPAPARTPADAALAPPPTAGDGPLLQRVQADIRMDRTPPGPHRAAPLAAEDRSVQIHRCHGRLRQVEVLRDTVLHLLADDPTLEPRDIVVLCPDIEAFAPLIEAVFGAERVIDHRDDGEELEAAPPPDLRVRLADRSLKRTNPVLRVLADLLDLADDRVTGAQILDLAAQAPVMGRYGLDEDDLGTLERWVDDIGVKWGLDAEHRRQHGVPTDQNTWQAGLARLLVGVAVADEGLRTAAGVVPYDDVEGPDVDLAGRFAELVARVHHLTARCNQAHTVQGWAELLQDAADLLTTTRSTDRWQQLQLARLLEELTTSAGGDHPTPLSLPEMRALLSDRLRGGPSRASHRTGDLTVCTLVPMRSVPHRVVCLLGLDDEVFPRRTAPDGDDLVQRAPCVGDRDPRTEDRQLLLDAVMAASETLVVLYSGHDERTNEPKPPAVPVGELIDVIDRTAATGDGRSASQWVTVQHPLQAFDARNFRDDELGRPGPYGFDTTALAAARASVQPRQPPPVFLDGPLEPVTGDLLELHDLIRFVEHPVAAFLQQRLQVRFPRDGDPRSDGLPVETTGLAKYQVGDRLLEAVLSGGSVERWREVERGRGTLPPGPLAGPALEDVESTVARLLEIAGSADVPLTPARSVHAEVSLPDQRRLVGSVDEVAGDVIRSIRFSRLSAKTRLGAWVRLLLLSAAQPERPWRAVSIGRAGTRSSKLSAVSVLGPIGDDPETRLAMARRSLAALVALHDRALREPLPLFCAPAAAYAEAIWRNRRQGRKLRPHSRARNAFEDRYGDANDPAVQAVYGQDLTFARILEEEPTPEESAAGWDTDEPTRFGRLALHVWFPLLDHEQFAEH